MSISEPTTELDWLRKRCEALEDELGRLKEAVQFLVYCKTTDPAFAYYNWLVKYDVFDRKRAILEHVLGVLDSRLAGRPLGLHKSIPGIANDQLYRSEPPTRENVRQLLMLALDTSNADTIDELLRAMSTQTPDRPLVRWWHQ